MCQILFFVRCRKLLLQQSQQNTPGGNQYMSLTTLCQQNTQWSQMLNLSGGGFTAVKESEWSKWRPDIHMSSAGWDSKNTGRRTRESLTSKDLSKSHNKVSHDITIIDVVERAHKMTQRAKETDGNIQDVGNLSEIKTYKIQQVSYAWKNKKGYKYNQSRSIKDFKEKIEMQKQKQGTER